MEKKDIKRIRTFIGLSHLSVNTCERHFVSDIYPIKKQDEMLSLIYAPDPVTGLPSNDVAMLLKNRDNPEIQRYIQQRLMIARDSVRGADNPDDALASIRAYKEDVIAYAQRMKDTFSPAEKVAGESE